MMKMKKRLGMLMMGILTLVQVLSVSTLAAESFPERISYLTIKAYNVEDETQTLANVLIEIFDEERQSLGIYETNQYGELLVEVIPGLYRIEVIESVEGFEPLNESKTQMIDASDIDLYQVNLLHAPIEAVSSRIIPKTGLENLMMPVALGFTLIAGGLYMSKRKK